MKKILILLVSVILIFLAWYLMNSFEDDVNTQKNNMMRTVSIPQQDNQVDSSPKVDDADDEIDSGHEEDNLGCAEKLAIAFPDLNQKFEKAFTEIYLTKSEMMGDDEYAYLDDQSLESLAYANDIKAMLYFSEKLIARSLNQNNKENESDLETINYEEFEEGIRLRWNAVVQSRPALLSEIVDKYAYRAGIEINRDQNLTNAIQSLATAKAYLLLVEKVFEKDPPLMRVLSNLEDFNERVSWILRNDAHKDELIKQISDKASALKQGLVKRWEQERAYHGKQLYPDFFSPEVEDYAQKLENQCFNY